ncbi:GNAT family N-acetyltransferase [Mariprofundus ferrooxydans]|uniref:N-acetyltransferase domain-containing protein n=1 Tax=Mariprofundus ferrooxydans PV-1 TaxID=314345 RepID=Q0EZX9_9PROT|nr:GNAT family N-acetyltransferase [Mariprofundus ferrooxydans]EAU54905.1 hypothetical protein SPV1_09428 [Mariprofundus ferrooxydans PV-1]KON46787.1 GNAT family acetyltransferase [Mariprofundus ferrooxydans]
MAFVDLAGRSIEIESDGDDIKAYHNGKCIGCIEFDHPNDFPTLWGMNVESAYQKSGIGTQMMRVAAELHGKLFAKPSFCAVGGKHASSDSYYTEEGAALIRRCIREGILEDTEPTDDFNDEW